MAAATCSRPESLEIDGDRCRQRQDAVAKIRAGEVADARSADIDDLGGDGLFARAADHPDVEALLGELRAASA